MGRVVPRHAIGRHNRVCVMAHRECHRHHKASVIGTTGSMSWPQIQCHGHHRANVMTTTPLQWHTATVMGSTKPMSPHDMSAVASPTVLRHCAVVSNEL